jgi:hypothetical protein
LQTRGSRTRGEYSSRKIEGSTNCSLRGPYSLQSLARFIGKARSHSLAGGERSRERIFKLIWDQTEILSAAQNGKITGNFAGPHTRQSTNRNQGH